MMDGYLQDRFINGIDQERRRKILCEISHKKISMTIYNSAALIACKIRICTHMKNDG
jgi:hypothetical protein